MIAILNAASVSAVVAATGNSNAAAAANKSGDASALTLALGILFIAVGAALVYNWAKAVFR